MALPAPLLLLLLLLFLLPMATDADARHAQRETFLRHKFEVGTRVEEGRGTCLYAARDFAAGEVVLSSEPLASLVFPSRVSELCNQCFRKAEAPRTLQHCVACKAAWYCSAECQKVAWERGRHKLECSIAGEVAAQCKFMPEIAQQDLRMLIRVALMRISPSSDAPELQGVFVARYDEVLRMPAHLDETTLKDPDRMDGNRMLADAALKLLDSRKLRAKKGLDWARLPALEDLVKVLCCLACNDFSIWDELILPLGLGVYPLGALLNHSCEPNCVLYYAPKTHAQVIRTIRHVKEGEELCHPYIDLACTTPERRAKLDASYHFRCDCSRCAAGTLDHRLASGTAEPPSHSQYLQGVVGLQSAEDSKELRDACNILQGVEREWRAARDPVDLKLLSLHSKLLQGWLELGEAEAAIEACRQLVEGYRVIYPPAHPLLGLQLYTLGNLEVDAGDRSAGERHLLEARGILTITHGEASRMVQGLDVLLSSC